MKTGKINMIACLAFICLLLNACSKSSNNPTDLSGKVNNGLTANSSGLITQAVGPGSGFDCFNDFFRYVNKPPEISTLHDYFDCIDKNKDGALGKPNIRQPKSSPVPPAPEIRTIDEVFLLAGMNPQDMYNEEKVNELKIILSPYVKLLNEALNKLGNPGFPTYQPSPGSPYEVNVEAIRNILDQNPMLDGYDRRFLLNFMYIVYNNRLGKPLGMMEKLGLDSLLYKPAAVNGAEL